MFSQFNLYYIWSTLSQFSLYFIVGQVSLTCFIQSALSQLKLYLCWEWRSAVCPQYSSVRTRIMGADCWGSWRRQAASRTRRGTLRPNARRTGPGCPYRTTASCSCSTTCCKRLRWSPYLNLTLPYLNSYSLFTVTWTQNNLNMNPELSWH